MRPNVAPALPRAHRRQAVVAAGAALLLAGCGAGSMQLRDADGRLQPCDSGPHCVTSETRDAARRVEPFRHDGTAADAIARLATVIKTMPGAAIVTQRDGYLHATFTTRLMRYVDDVEFTASATPGELAVRSSSRIGYYDFGANRDRVEAIRAAFLAAR